MQASEVRPPLEARKAQLTLEEVRNRLAQLEGDRASRSKSDEAAMAVAREKETKAQFAIQTATTILAQMSLKASIDGVVAVAGPGRMDLSSEQQQSRALVGAQRVE